VSFVCVSVCVSLFFVKYTMSLCVYVRGFTYVKWHADINVRVDDDDIKDRSRCLPFLESFGDCRTEEPPLWAGHIIAAAHAKKVK
jgi:hypothetical protein